MSVELISILRCHLWAQKQIFHFWRGRICQTSLMLERALKSQIHTLISYQQNKSGSDCSEIKLFDSSTPYLLIYQASALFYSPKKLKPADTTLSLSSFNPRVVHQTTHHQVTRIIKSSSIILMSIVFDEIARRWCEEKYEIKPKHRSDQEGAIVW